MEEEKTIIYYEPYVVVRCSNGLVVVRQRGTLMIEDPAEALETAKKIAEDMQKADGAIIMEIGITEEDADL